MVTTPAPILPDSCVCIRWMRDHAEGKKPAPMPTRHIGAIVVAELLVAAKKHHRSDTRQRQIEHLLAGMTIVPFDTTAAHHYAEIRAHLEKAGSPIGPMDLLIAAQARSLGATLITLNAREFQKVPGLHWIAP